MTNLEDRGWVESALDFWLNVTPAPERPRRLIAWNVEQLTLALERLPCRVCDGDGCGICLGD